MTLKQRFLNDLDDKLHGIAELALARPEVGELLDRESANMSPKESAAMYCSIRICVWISYASERGVKGQ